MANNMFKFFLIASGGTIATLIICLFAAILFGGPIQPKPHSMNERFQSIDWGKLAPTQHYETRDRSLLAYRYYRAESSNHKIPLKNLGSVILVHGSSANNSSMMLLALAFADSGYEVYALDMRGHGNSGIKGHISYIGQLEDDVVDFMTKIKPKTPTTLIGFSSGGGFVLRFAASEQEKLFQSYLLMAPFLSQNAPTYRPNSGGWVEVGLPRIIALNILNKIGVKWFNWLAVVAFAVDDNIYANLTSSYSYNLEQNFRPHENYELDITSVRSPMMVMVGANDVQFYADKFAPLFANHQPEIQTIVVPNIDHIGLILEPSAAEKAINLLNQLAKIQIIK